MQNKKKIAIYAGIVVIILAGIFFFGSGNSKKREYTFSKVGEGEVKKTISVTGTLNVLDPVVLLSKINGIIEKVYTDFNKNVSKGSLLLKIDEAAISQKVMKISANLDSVKLELASAQRELEGKRNLYRDNLISKKAMETAEIQYKTAFSNYKRVQLDYELAMAEKKSARVYAPINGIVIALYKKNNEPAVVNQPLVLLAPTLKKMSLTINIDESDIGNVKDGQIVYFSVSAFPDKQFRGVIKQVRINPVQNRGVVTYEAEVTCENMDLLLKPGMTATATVEVSKKEKTIRVPNQAFIVSPDSDSENHSSKRNFIYLKTGVISDKPYKKVKVSTGIIGDMFTEVKSGLKSGDEVLIKFEDKK